MNVGIAMNIHPFVLQTCFRHLALLTKQSLLQSSVNDNDNENASAREGRGGKSTIARSINSQDADFVQNEILTSVGEYAGKKLLIIDDYYMTSVWRVCFVG